MFFAIAMLLSAQDPVITTNQAYNDCLMKLTVSSLDEKRSEKEFVAAANDVCASQRDAYRAAVVKSEREFGSSQADAASYADEEIANILAMMKNNYANYSESNTRPVLR
ncbi:hypothetical protein [Novosphingopyxis iocasae]|uniref:hypothetical protein n=1 Tax=Novosphingopyxis iocasae TaxID=2762729 RepID=UPI00165147BA|nr:hypothetical protein [Novosphingopyxis iocasae]